MSPDPDDDPGALPPGPDKAGGGWIAAHQADILRVSIGDELDDGLDKLLKCIDAGRVRAHRKISTESESYSGFDSPEGGH